MRLDQFRIGMAFSDGLALWRCTDIGTRVVVAIRLDQATVRREVRNGDGSTDAVYEEIDPRQEPSWLAGPPYALAETVFGEYDLDGCREVADPLAWTPSPEDGP